MSDNEQEDVNAEVHEEVLDRGVRYRPKYRASKMLKSSPSIFLVEVTAIDICTREILN